MKPVRWGILGPGAIGRKFARDARAVPGCVVDAVAGRALERAQAFARENGIARALPSAAALAEDPAIDAVYVSTPHPSHFESARLAISCGKAVLVEKPMTINAGEASRLVEAAREAGVFLMEALWTRFLPVYEDVRRWIDDGAIGRIRSVTSSFCVRGHQDPRERWLNPALAGGSLLDLGVYCLAMHQFAIGSAAESLTARAVFSPSGVDEMVGVVLTHPGGVLGQFTCGLAAHGNNSLTISGETGRICVPDPFFAAQRAELLSGGTTHAIDRPFLSGGFEYQIAEVVRCLHAGLTESPRMSPLESLQTLQTMDAIRAQIGLSYPAESALGIAPVARQDQRSD